MQQAIARLLAFFSGFKTFHGRSGDSAAVPLGLSRGILDALPGDMPPRDLIERTRLFALAVVRFCRTLPRTDEARETAKHLRSSANSTRSNYRASRKGRSREEFQAKLQIAFEEADECVDCLEFLRDARIKSNAALLQEANEIAKILGASVQTARQNTARLKTLPRS